LPRVPARCKLTGRCTELTMNLADHDLNLLVTLHALLTERNVTRAAKKLGLSQSTVSGALARLRIAFGDELLVRVGRNLELTPFAQRLLDPLEETLHGLEGLLSLKASFDPQREQRNFRIAARDYLAYLIMPPLTAELRGSAPEVVTSFSPLDAGSLQLLAEGRLDFVMLPGTYQHQFPTELMFEDRWVCAVWNEHPDVGDVLTEAQYLALEHLIFMPGPGKRLAARPNVSHTDLKRRAVATIESLALMPFLLRGTRMIALVPERMALRVQDIAGIRLLAPPHRLPPLRQVLCWNPRRSNDPSHQWMRQLIVKTARSL
jgi:LysR family transcriptional regulator, nod-box dependent transcriptional activator